MNLLWSPWMVRAIPGQDWDRHRAPSADLSFISFPWNWKKAPWKRGWAGVTKNQVLNHGLSHTARCLASRFWNLDYEGKSPWQCMATSYVRGTHRYPSTQEHYLSEYSQFHYLSTMLYKKIIECYLVIHKTWLDAKEWSHGHGWDDLRIRLRGSRCDADTSRLYKCKVIYIRVASCDMT